MSYRRLALLVLLFSALGGCGRVGDDYVVPAGHPADPAARAGLPLPPSAALRPELKDVKPELAPAAQPEPGRTPAPDPHGQHRQ